jgi:hypothetical protein
MTELPAPPGFDPGRLGTWPRIEGRLEFVDGGLPGLAPALSAFFFQLR